MTCILVALDKEIEKGSPKEILSHIKNLFKIATVPRIYQVVCDDLKDLSSLRTSVRRSFKGTIICETNIGNNACIWDMDGVGRISARVKLPKAEDKGH